MIEPILFIFREKFIFKTFLVVISWDQYKLIVSERFMSELKKCLIEMSGSLRLLRE